MKKGMQTMHAADALVTESQSNMEPVKYHWLLYKTYLVTTNTGRKKCVRGRKSVPP